MVMPAKNERDDVLPLVGIADAKLAGNRSNRRQHRVNRHGHHGGEQGDKENEFLL